MSDIDPEDDNQEVISISSESSDDESEPEDNPIAYYHQNPQEQQGGVGQRSRHLLASVISAWEREGEARTQRLRYRSEDAHSESESDIEVSTPESSDDSEYSASSPSSDSEEPVQRAPSAAMQSIRNHFAAAQQRSLANSVDRRTVVERTLEHLMDCEQSAETDNQDSACVVCLSHLRTVVSLPCGHAQYCVECARVALINQMTQHRNAQLSDCAVCRKPSSAWQHIFL